MKIAVLGPIYPYRGGIAHYTARFAQALGEYHEVKVFSFKRLYPAFLYPGRSDKDPSQKALKIDMTYTIDSINPYSWLSTANKIRQFRPDMLVIEWWVTFLAPVVFTIAHLCRRNNIKVVFLIHNVLPHENNYIHRPLAKFALRQGDHFIVHTPKECDRLLSLIPSAKVEVCPFPMYDVVEQVILTQAEARRQLQIPEIGRVVLFFGIVRPYKGLIYLIEALTLLLKKGLRIYLVVAGEFWEDKKTYLQKIEAAGLSEQVKLEDRYIPDEEVGLFFKATDLIIAPYVDGTQSAVSALALGFGTPLLATEWSIAGIDEVNSGLVRVVPSGNAESLAEGIQSFFKDQECSGQHPHRAAASRWEGLIAILEKFMKSTLDMSKEIPR